MGSLADPGSFVVDLDSRASDPKTANLALPPRLSVALQQAFLTIRPDATPPEIKAFLTARAGDLVTIRMAVAHATEKANGVAVPAAQIRILIEGADFAAADRLLSQIEGNHRSAAQKGDVRYIRGNVALLECDLSAAAGHFAAACDHLYPHAPDLACSLRNSAATKLYEMARSLRVGHNLPIGLFRANLDFWRRDWHPEPWAMTQVNLANALFLEASLSTGEARNRLVEEAVTRFRNALAIYQEATHRREWTQTQSALAAALIAKARTVHGEAAAELLAEAATAYQAALRHTDKRAKPLMWAANNSHLSTALTRQVPLSTPGKEAGLLQKAVDADGAALTVYQHRVAPLHRIARQNSLGNTLRMQAARAPRQEAVRLLTQASATYRDALATCDPDQQPREWSTLHHNLALTLLDQARRGSSLFADTLLRESLKAAEAALAARTGPAQRREWSSTQTMIGDILTTRATLDDRQDAYQHADKAVAAFQDAIRVLGDDISPSHHADMHLRIGAACEIAAQAQDKVLRLKYLERSRASFGQARMIAVRARLSGFEAMAKAGLDRLRHLESDVAPDHQGTSHRNVG